MKKKETILEVKQVQKFYGNFQAVKDAEIEIKRGDIYALLGHNGAGKSTLIKMILGLVKPSGGDIKIEGLSYEDKNREIKKKIGYLPERMNFYDNLTAWETINFYAKLKGLHMERCEEVLEQVGLIEAKHRRVGAFSKGMQQRLGLAQAIIHKPNLLVLDEPTTGLDPTGILEFKNMIRQWNKEGTTILFSSHNLNDVEELTREVGIMYQGQIVAQGNLGDLQEGLNLQTKIEIELASNPIYILEKLGKRKIIHIHNEGNRLIIYCTQNKKIEVLKTIGEEEFNVINFSIKEPGLDLIYQCIMEQINKGKFKRNQ